LSERIEIPVPPDPPAMLALVAPLLAIGGPL